MFKRETPAWIKKELEKDPSRKNIINKDGANRRLADIIESGSNKPGNLDKMFEDDTDGKDLEKF